MKMHRTVILTALILSLFTGISASDRVNFHGFVSQGFLFSDENNFLAPTSEGTFDFNEMALNASARLMRNLHVGLQFTARDFGDTGQNQVFLDWAFADYQLMRQVGFRAGIAKTSFGLLTDFWDVDIVRTNIFLPIGVYPDNFRDVWMTNRGFGAYGRLHLWDVGNMMYDMMIGSNNVELDGSFARWVESRQGVPIDDFSMEYKFNGSLFWETPLPGFSTKFSVLDSDFSLFVYNPLMQSILETGNRATCYLGSVQYRWENLELSAEYSTIDIDQVTYIPVPGMPNVESQTGIEGWYARADYRFNDWFQAGVYYTEYYPDRDDKDGEDLHAANPDFPEYYGWQKDICLTARFDPVPGWLIKLEGHMMNGCGSLLVMDQEDISESAEDWFLMAAKLSYAF